MTIVRRVGRERERMLGMTDEERAWRKKWLDAQKLAPEEPVTPKGYYEEMYNPIRRFYSAPMNKVQNMLEPLMVTRAYNEEDLFNYTYNIYKNINYSCLFTGPYGCVCNATHYIQKCNKYCCNLLHLLSPEV